MSVEVKENLGDKKFHEWMQKQLRLAGEELIRRSGRMDFTGWDMMTGIAINVEIPTYADEIRMPEIEFVFTAVNKCTIDDLINAGMEVNKNTNES